MRESNYTFPPQNRAVTNITHMIYDRRALDTNSSLALLNSLTSLTYLTSTSPRIRDILTVDGGLERLLDILRDSCLPKDSPVISDLWGLNGPPTARVITVERGNSLRHSLAFQCVVNIGVRGSEEIRTRVVQAGALDLVAQILESWLRDHGLSIFAGHLGSEAAVQAFANGQPIPGVEQLRRREREKREERGESERAERVDRERAERIPHRRHSRSQQGPSSQEFPMPSTSTPDVGRPLLANFVFDPNTGTWSHANDVPTPNPQPQEPHVDTDVDMADGEGGGETDDASVADDISIDVDVSGGSQDGEISHQPSTTPRAATSFLPMTIPVPVRGQTRETQSQGSSVGDSLSGDETNNSTLPRNTSESDITGAQGLRPPALNLVSARIPHLAQDPVSTQSSPMGTPTRMEISEGGMQMRATRRGTIVGRPVSLAPRNDRRREHTAGSGTSDGGEDIDLPTATINAGIAAANAQAMEGNGTIVPDEPGPPPNVEIVEATAGQELDEPDPEAIAAEQARLDMEAGAPPGQPGAVAQTPRVNAAEAATPRQAPGQDVPATTPDQAQIIIANGAPRGFQDLGSYVGISSLLNPDGNRYSDDSILLALQLLAYLSKYPHVRTAFHHPRRPMHHTFDLGLDYVANPLPERPPYSETPDIFSLVERFTFRPSPSDPLVFKIPPEIQYWAGVIMRNACRKDEARGGIRQCANMSCGKWEKFPREFAKCRRCRKAKYCSKECQSRAWQEGHRFWCSSRTDQEPGSAAAEGAAGVTPQGSQAAPAVAAEDDGDFQIGLQMGLSPEVVTRALAAARAAGVLPAQGARARGATAPSPSLGQRAAPAPAPAVSPSPRGNGARGLAAAAVAIAGGSPISGPRGATHAHAHLIEGDAARQLALDSQRWRLPNPNDHHDEVHDRRARPPSPPRPETWRRFQNVGASLGLRQENGAGQQSNAYSPGSRFWPADPQRPTGSSGQSLPQAPTSALHSSHDGEERRSSSSNTGTGTSAGGDSRRGSSSAVRGLGFNLTEDRNGRSGL